jgi:hypothetical protein
MSKGLSTSVATKPNWTSAISGLVAAAISLGITYWTKIDHGYVLLFTAPLGYAYHWLIQEGEKKFPWLSVFFLALPSNLPTPPVTPPVTPPASTFVETDKGVWAADVNAIAKANEVSKAPVPPVTSSRPKPVTKPKSTPKTKR